MKLDFTKKSDVISTLINKYQYKDDYINALKSTSDDKYDILILNLNILFKYKSYSPSDLIHIILEIEKCGFKFHCQLIHYIYFLKKKSFYNRLFKKHVYK